MANIPVSQVQRQVTKASRRLFVQTLLDSLAWCWPAALLVSTLWFLLQPLILRDAVDWLRWAVAGGGFTVATIAGIWLAYRRAPSRIESALELDQRFQLKERATTSLTLPEELLQTMAGQALAADAEAHVAKVDVRQGFPLKLRWTAWLLPACAIALTLVAFFYNPIFSPQTVVAETQKVRNAKQIAEAYEKAKKAANIAWPKEDKSPELDEIEKLKDALFKQPFDANDKDKIREQMQKMVTLEEKIKNRLEDRKAQDERTKAMQSKLKEMGKDPEKKLTQEGPAKDLQDSLNKGDLSAAQKELADLAEKLKDNKLSAEDLKLLEKQISDIQKMLDNLADLKDLKDQLLKDLQDGKLTKEEFDKLMSGTLDDAELLKDLKDFSGKLGECKNFIEGGDLKNASKLLVDISKDFDPDSQEFTLLQAEQLRLMELRMLMQQGLGGGGPPGTERPIAEDAKTGKTLEKQKGVLNPKTPFRITGDQKGGQFSKIPPSQVGGAFQKAQQDAPEAIERQQVPPDAADAVRGYYQNLGGSKKK